MGSKAAGTPVAYVRVSSIGLSVVMPAFNEADFLGRAVGEVAEGLRAREVAFEIIVAENGSTDDTYRVAQDLARSTPELRVVHLDAADYGGAMRAGLLEARGDVVAVFDVDYYDLDFLDGATARLRGPDTPAVVVGSKRAAGARDERGPLRRSATAVFQAMLRWVFGLGVSDTHGMKVMRRAPIAPLARQCRFGTDLFDSELILRAERAGLVVAEIPVAVHELRPARTSILRRVPRTLVGLLKLRVVLWRDHPEPAES
jgi:glycosyltransferase involved in cell wall biosynthesis